MTREESKSFLIDISYKLGNMAIEYLTEKDGEKMREAIKALEQEPCEVFDKYGNYKYPNDVELTEPNTATSMPCEDAISRQATLKPYKGLNDEDTISVWLIRKNIEQQPPVNPQPKTEWIPVSERLPEEYGEYLVTWTTSQSKRPFIGISEGEVTGEYDHEHNRFKVEWLLEDYVKNYPDVKVMAWMPLPALFEPQESVE